MKNWEYVHGPFSLDSTWPFRFYRGKEFTVLEGSPSNEGRLPIIRVIFLNQTFNSLVKVEIDNYPASSTLEGIKFGWSLNFLPVQNPQNGKLSGAFKLNIGKERIIVPFPLTEAEIYQTNLLGSVYESIANGIQILKVPFAILGPKTLYFTIPRPWIDWPKNEFAAITPSVSPNTISNVFEVFRSLGFGVDIV